MELPGFVPSWSAEFPNDNPALHEGASWVCLQVCGAPRAIARPRAMNVRSDVPAAFATEAPITTEATSNEAPPSAVIEGGNSMQVRNADAWCPQVDDTVMAAGWDDDAWIAVSEEPAVGAGWEDDLAIGMAEEPAAAGWEDAWSALGDEAPAATAGWDDDVTPLRVAGQVPSLEALTLSFEADLLPDEPLRLDALDVAATLASEDAVFDFDGDDATGAVFHVPRVEERGAHAVALDESPVAADPFAAYVAAVVDVAQVAGYTRAAAALPLLLQGV
jgi:hypothetical protein